MVEYEICPIIEIHWLTLTVYLYLKNCNKQPFYKNLNDISEAWFLVFSQVHGDRSWSLKLRGHPSSSYNNFHPKKLTTHLLPSLWLLSVEDFIIIYLPCIVLRERAGTVCSVMSDSLQPHSLKPTRPPCPWNFPGKHTGVDYHFLLQRGGMILHKNWKTKIMNL